MGLIARSRQGLKQPHLAASRVPASVAGCQVVFGYLGGMGVQCATGVAPAEALRSGILTRATAHGMAAYAAGSTSGIAWSDVYLEDGRDYTVIVAINDHTGRGSIRMPLSADNFNMAPMRRNFSLRLDDDNRLRVTWFETDNSERIVYTTAVPANTPTVIAARVQAKVLTAWLAGVNGTPYTGSADFRGLPLSDYLAIACFSNSGYSRAFYGDILGAWVLQGALRDEVMRSLRRPEDAFALLTTPRRYYVPTSYEAGLPTLSAATYMPGSLTSSGFRPRVTAS